MMDIENDGWILQNLLHIMIMFICWTKLERRYFTITEMHWAAEPLFLLQLLRERNISTAYL